MTRKGSTCKRDGCETKFHACSGCDLSDWEWDYCSNECYHKAKEEGFRKVAEKYGIDPEKIEEVADDLSEWIYSY
jgi:hypothetical protein